MESIYVSYKNISPANKSLFVPALCSALSQVPDRNREDPAGVVLEGEVGVRHLQCHGDSDQSAQLKHKTEHFLHILAESGNLCV